MPPANAAWKSWKSGKKSKSTATEKKFCRYGDHWLKFAVRQRVTVVVPTSPHHCIKRLALAKKRIVKDYDALSEDIIRQVKMKYPTGYSDYLLFYNDKEGKKVSALPFETDDVYYLIRMTMLEAKRLIKEDVDYDEEGVLREDFSGIEVESEFDGQGEDDDDVDEGVSEEDDHIIVTRRRDEDAEDIPDDTEY